MVSRGNHRYLGDELVVVGQVSSAVDAAVRSVAARQVRLESLGARHSDHGWSWRAVQEGTASPGRLTREAPQHTGEGRGGRWVGRRTPERTERIKEQLVVTWLGNSCFLKLKV